MLPMIELENITVEFSSNQYRYSTLKEYVVNRMRGMYGVTRFRALNEVRLTIQKGESMALLGHNGSGKSTLLRVIARIYEPRGARIVTRGRVAPMIELGAGFDGELSGRENIELACSLMGLSTVEIKKRMDSIIAFAELEQFIDTPFKNYSSGMQARLGFACTTAVDPDILLVDEVLSVGDSNFQQKCLQRLNLLKERGCTIVLVSHDPETVRKHCSTAAVLNQGRLLYAGPVEEAMRVQTAIMQERAEGRLAATQSTPVGAEVAQSDRFSGLRGDQPIQKAASFKEVDGSLRVSGLQSFAVSRVVPLVQDLDPALACRYGCLKDIFVPKIFSRRTVVDLNGAYGAWGLMALGAGAARVTVVDADAASVACVKRIAGHLKDFCIESVQEPFPGASLKADVVLALEFCDWFAAARGVELSVDKLVEAIASIAGDGCLIEWAEVDDRALPQASCLRLSGGQKGDWPTLAQFRLILERYFGSVSAVGALGQARALFWASKGQRWLDLSWAPDLALDVSFLVSSGALARIGEREFWSRVFVLPDCVCKQATQELVECEYRALSLLVGTGFPRAEILRRGSGWALLKQERLPGESLERVLHERRLTASECGFIASELLARVAALESVGIAHRDIQPKNILVDFAGRTVSLIDFAWAEVPGLPLLEPGALGNSGLFRGRPPEGGTHDLFALGRVLLELGPNLPAYWVLVAQWLTKPERTGRPASVRHIQEVFRYFSAEAPVPERAPERHMVSSSSLFGLGGGKFEGVRTQVRSEPSGAFAVPWNLEASELAFIDRIHWFLEATRQDSTHINRTLRRDTAVLAEIGSAVGECLVVVFLSNANVSWLEDTILSLRCQTWCRWRLMIVLGKNFAEPPDVAAAVAAWVARDSRISVCRAATDLPGLSTYQAFMASESEFVMSLEVGDVLHPMALGLFVRHFVARVETELAYSNHALLTDHGGVHSFISKPEFDEFTLLRFNYVGSAVVLRRSLLTRAMPPIQVGAEWGQSDFSLHDVLLRVASLNPVVCHIPLFAVYFREGQRGNRLASDGTCAVSPTLRERLDALYGLGGYLVTETALPGFLSVLPRVRLNQGGKRPSLFVIVPFRDGLELTLACLSSLEAQVHNLEVVVVLLNNASQKNETVEGLAQWQARARHNRYITVDYPGAFNFAKINNVAIAMAIDALGWSPDLVMFLNNDVELTDTRSLETMAAQCLADTRTGFVGMRLLFPDGELQHGGVGEQPVLDMAGYPRIGHNNKPSQFCTVEHECMAVTFAAAMTRFAVYAELGGLDEIFTPNGFGDVDACLRARSLGYRSHYFGTLAGVHNESRTRGVTYEEIEFTSLHDRNAAQLGILRVRQLAEDLQPELVRVAQCTQLIEGNESDLPIRFQIANAIHGVAVRLLGDEAKQRLKPVVRRFLKW